MLLAPARAIIPPPDYAGMATTLQRLAVLLAAGRVRHGLTLSQQAKQMGVSLTTLSNLDRGGIPSYATTLSALGWLSIYTP